MACHGLVDDSAVDAWGRRFAQPVAHELLHAAAEILVSPSPSSHRLRPDRREVAQGALAREAAILEAIISRVAQIDALAPRILTLLVPAGRRVAQLRARREAPSVPQAEREGLQPRDAVDGQRLVRPDLIGPRRQGRIAAQP